MCCDLQFVRIRSGERVERKAIRTPRKAFDNEIMVFRDDPIARPMVAPLEANHSQVKTWPTLKWRLDVLGEIHRTLMSMAWMQLDVGKRAMPD